MYGLEILLLTQNNNYNTMMMMHLKSPFATLNKFGVSPNTRQNLAVKMSNQGAQSLQMFNNCKFFSIALRKANQTQPKPCLLSTQNRQFRTSTIANKSNESDLYGKCALIN